MNKITDHDIATAIKAYSDTAECEFLYSSEVSNHQAALRAVVHALAERWSQPALDPVVTERPGKIIEEIEE